MRKSFLVAGLTVLSLMPRILDAGPKPGDAGADPAKPAAQSPKEAPVAAAEKGASAEKVPAETNTETIPAKKRQDAKDRDQQSGKEKAKATEAEREAAALRFAKQHHPELAGLIEQLKAMNPVEYQPAIRDLERTSERLAPLEQKDPKRFDLELDAWKIASRIRLIAARLTMARDEALEQELRDAVAAQVDARLNLLLLEQEQLNARLQKLDATIETAQASRDDQAKKNFDNLMRTITKGRAGKALKQAGKKKGDQKLPAGANGADAPTGAATPDVKTP